MIYEVTSWLCYSYIIARLWLLLQLLCQPWERLCYGCHATQERANLFAVPMAPGVSFQPLNSRLATLGKQTVRIARQLVLWLEWRVIHIITIDLGYLTNKMVPQCVLSMRYVKLFVMFLGVLAWDTVQTSMHYSCEDYRARPYSNLSGKWPKPS